MSQFGTRGGVIAAASQGQVGMIYMTCLILFLYAFSLPSLQGIQSKWRSIETFTLYFTSSIIFVNFDPVLSTHVCSQVSLFFCYLAIIYHCAQVMAELTVPAAKRLCTAAVGNVKRIAIEGNIGRDEWCLVFSVYYRHNN